MAQVSYGGAGAQAGHGGGARALEHTDEQGAK